MQSTGLDDMRGKKTALVLSGGVVKAAAWHLGVALALQELGFSLLSNKTNDTASSGLQISTYVGSSAGALINLYFASGITPMEIIDAHMGRPKSKIPPIGYRDMLHLKKSLRTSSKSKMYDPFEGFPGFLKKILSPVVRISGIFSTHGLLNYINQHILTSNDFHDYVADLFVVATNLDHSRKSIFSKYNYPNPSHDPTAEYLNNYPIAEAIAGSMSVPPFYSPFPVKNPTTGAVDYYIDGEIRETLSSHVAIDNGCEFVICSWTHSPYHFNDEIGSLINYGLPAICTQAIYLMIQKKIIAARARRLTAEDVINTVNQYMLDNKFTSTHRNKITSILERKLDYNPKIKFIDIYPENENYRMFFSNSFSLNPQRMSVIVTMGYKKTKEIFNKLK